MCHVRRTWGPGLRYCASIVHVQESGCVLSGFGSDPDPGGGGSGGGFGSGSGGAGA